MSVAAGYIDYLPFTAYTAPGVPLSVASKAAFVAAGWNIVVWLAGVVVSSPTWDLVVVNQSAGEYEIAFTAQIGQGELRITGPTSAAFTNPDGFILDYDSYSNDLLAALFNQTQGVIGSFSQADYSLGDYVDGDTFLSPAITIPAAKMSALGQTTLSGLTIEAAAKTQPTDTQTNLPTPSVVDSTNRIIKINIAANTLPTLAAGITASLWYIDVQLIKSGTPNIIATVLRYTINQLWQRDTRTT